MEIHVNHINTPELKLNLSKLKPNRSDGRGNTCLTLAWDLNIYLGRSYIQVGNNPLRMELNVKELKFELLDHTADLSIKIYGKSDEEIFSNAVYAFNKITVDEFSGVSGESQFILRSSNIENLLVDFLSRLIFELEVNGIVHTGVNSMSINDNSIFVRLNYTDIKELHEYSNVIKGVTYHNLSYDLKNGYATVVFDV
jgi:SHS2 domain-containing protein